jgi:hypothetical protein
MQRTLLTLALIATAGVAQAQTMDRTNASGGPVIGRDDWVRQRGDQAGPASGRAGGPAMSTGTMSSPGMSHSTASAPPMAAGEPRDPYGRPFIGRNDWTRQRGDQPGPASGGGAGAASMGGGSTMPMTTGPTTTGGSRQGVMKDEFGNRYDSQGNRIDARGNVVPPPVSR